jgi:4-hydroxythreonine-4-phosphate dehydrogenase
MSTYVFTCGDINGIGPEIVVKTINKKLPSKNRKIIFICPKNVFENTTRIITPLFSYKLCKKLPVKIDTNSVSILNIGDFRQNYGQNTKESGKASSISIIKACELVKNNIAEAIITAPISKLAFSKAGINFPGHTEMLADYFKVKKFVMMFLSKKMKAGLVTIHVPIKDVSKLITREKVENVLDVILHSLKLDFNQINPRIALLGLNPHSGEEGKIGSEEEEILKPVLKQYKNNVDGPFVPDAYFGNKLFKNYDCTIGLYHDQVLIPFKLLNFERGVNFTSGMPIVRTSPDHGTAFDIAGKGIANAKSMIEAVNYASLIVKNRKSSLETS